MPRFPGDDLYLEHSPRLSFDLNTKKTLPKSPTIVHSAILKLRHLNIEQLDHLPL